MFQNGNHRTKWDLCTSMSSYRRASNDDTIYYHLLLFLLSMNSVASIGTAADSGSSSLAINRKKFRSQTSDNMDRWKSRGGKSQRREEKKKEDQRRERVRRKKMYVCDKVEKSRNTVFFLWFVAPEGREVGSLKRRVRSHLARWEIKNCTPLWREAYFEVQICKTHQVWSMFVSWDVEKAHAIVARSTFGSEHAKKPHVRTTLGPSTAPHYTTTKQYNYNCNCYNNYNYNFKLRTHYSYKYNYNFNFN